MTIHSPPHHGTDESPPKRPRGILKNRSTSNVTATSPPPPTASEAQRPIVSRELSERDIVVANTLANAGPNRRSSSNPGGLGSRRASSARGTNGTDVDENSPRLKWDEANLYLNEQEQGDHMKITEPKTPYAKQYDPTEDEQELAKLNADDLVVDEVDKKRVESGELPTTKANRVKDGDIPDLDIGDAEMVDVGGNATPDSEKRVMVDPDFRDEGHHDPEDLADMTEEEKAKHRKFEQMRKKHYEMKDVKGLLGHPEQLDDDDDDEQGSKPVPPVPSLPVS